jgi:hypothetical protein
MWPRRIQSRSNRHSADFAPSRGHSVTVNCSHSRNTKGTSVVSVPRWEGMLPFRNQPGRLNWPLEDVSAETAKFRFLEEKEGHPGPARRLSTRVRSGLRNRLSERCVNCVSSAVALRKRIPELRTPSLPTRVMRPVALRTRELRTGVPSSFALDYPPASSPRNTLAGVFERMKRTARSKRLARITERLAPQYQRSASPAEVTRWLAAKRVRRSEFSRPRQPEDE